MRRVRPGQAAVRYEQGGLIRRLRIERLVSEGRNKGAGEFGAELTIDGDDRTVVIAPHQQVLDSGRIQHVPDTE